MKKLNPNPNLTNPLKRFRPMHHQTLTMMFGYWVVADQQRGEYLLRKDGYPRRFSTQQGARDAAYKAAEQYAREQRADIINSGALASDGGA